MSGIGYDIANGANASCSNVDDDSANIHFVVYDQNAKLDDGHILISIEPKVCSSHDSKGFAHSVVDEVWDSGNGARDGGFTGERVIGVIDKGDDDGETFTAVRRHSTRLLKNLVLARRAAMQGMGCCAKARLFVFCMVAERRRWRVWIMLFQVAMFYLRQRLKG